MMLFTWLQYATQGGAELGGQIRRGIAAPGTAGQCNQSSRWCRPWPCGRFPEKVPGLFRRQPANGSASRLQWQPADGGNLPHGQADHAQHQHQYDRHQNGEGLFDTVFRHRLKRSFPWAYKNRPVGNDASIVQTLAVQRRKKIHILGGTCGPMAGIGPLQYDSRSCRRGGCLHPPAFML